MDSHKSGITTSIRLSPKIRQQLEKTAQNLHRGKNWVIEHALAEYFARMTSEEFRAEAKRQSLLASQMDAKDADLFEESFDDTGWESQ